MSDPRKPAPGSNSWAQSSEKGRIPKARPSGPKQPGPPTNRSKYENKALPLIPQASSSSSSQAEPTLPHRTMPVTPSARPPQRNQDSKDRAATNPVIPQPLVATKMTSSTELRKGSELTTPAREVSDEEMPLENQPASLPSAVSDHGSEVVRAYPVAGNNQGELSLSAPPTTTNTRHPFFPLSEDRPTSPVLRGYRLRETNWPTPTLSYGSLASKQHMSDTDSDEMPRPRHLGMMIGDGLMNPTRDGGFARKGEVSIVNQNDSQRVASHIGVIETVKSPGASNAPDLPSHLERTLSQLEGRLREPTILRPRASTTSMGSESNYGGVWENHPHVGRSLPPFTSGSSGLPPHPGSGSHHRSFSSRSAVVPTMFDDSRGAYSRTSSGFPSSLYNNFGMPSSRGNSYASSNMPSAMYNMHPAAIHGLPNPVPPPPRSYPGYQPPVQIPAGMEEMERNLHHHLDQCFGSLTRLMTDKSDKIVDKMMKQLEESEDKMDKALKAVKGEVRELKKEATSQHREIKDVAKVTGSIQEKVSGVDVAVKGVGLKIDALEKKMDESDSEREMVVRQPDESIRRRTESAHATLPQNEQRRHRPNPSPIGLRQGRQTSRGRQDNVSGSGTRRQTDRSIRREHFTQVGVMRGEPPDLSQHPAYRRQQGQSTEYNQDAGRVAAGFQADESTSYQTPSLQNSDWYRRAYGE